MEDSQQVLQEVSCFLQATPAQVILDLHILTPLCNAACDRDELRRLSSNTCSLAGREVAGSLRDGCLCQIFKIALETLQRLRTRQAGVGGGAAEDLRELRPSASRSPSRAASLFRSSTTF